MSSRGIAAPIVVVVIIVIVLAVGLGYFFIVVQKPTTQENMPPETSPTPEVSPTPTPTPGPPPENQPPENKPPGQEGITVQSISSTYRVAPGGTSGWFHTGQDADIMLSGFGFDNAGGPLSFRNPTGIASDNTHLLLADTWNNRVLIWNSLPTSNVPPDIVLGQENFYANNSGNGLDQMNWPMGVSTDEQRVVVADTNNDRILIWNTFPTENGQPADMVIQGDPSSPTRWIDWPWGVWTDGTKLIVSSTASARVLIWNTFPTRDNQAADVCLTGQGQIGTPRNITCDGVHLIVGDHNPNVSGHTGSGNFFWSTIPAIDQPPTFFMPDPVDPRGAWMRGTFTPDGKLIMQGVELYIWNTFPTDNTDLPDLSVGRHAPGGSEYWFKPAEGSGVVYANGRLYLTSNNVIICYNSLPTTKDAHPDFAVGGPDVYTNTLETNYFITNPVPVSNGTSLFVSSDSGKLYVWKHLPDESGAHPDIVYSGLMAPWANTIFENTLILAGKDTVYIWNELPLNGEMPDIQFKRNIGSATFQELRGVEFDGRYFYLADRDANKIYVWEGIPDNTTDPKFTISADVPTCLTSDGTYLVVACTEAENSNRRIRFYRIDQLSSAAQPTFLTGINVNLPQAVLAVDGHLFFGDTAFNRVLIWNDIADAVGGQAPNIVLGAEDFNDTSAEIGRDKLFMPAALSFDGSYLWVGEFKFSGRILRFSPSYQQLENQPLIRLYFTYPTNPEVGKDYLSQNIGSACSTDGVHFTLEAGARLSGAYLSDPDAFKESNTWTIFYSKAVAPEGPEKFALFKATCATPNGTFTTDTSFSGNYGNITSTIKVENAWYVYGVSEGIKVSIYNPSTNSLTFVRTAIGGAAADPSVIQLSSNSFKMYYKSAGNIYCADSSDALDWGPGALVVPNAEVPGAVYVNGKIYLYYVNSAPGADQGKILVRISSDNGATFSSPQVVTGLAEAACDPDPVPYAS